MTNLANGRVGLNFNKSVLYISYELNNWSHNPTNNFIPKNGLFGTFKAARNANKSIFTCNSWGIYLMEKVCRVFVMVLLEML